MVVHGCESSTAVGKMSASIGRLSTRIFRLSCLSKQERLLHLSPVSYMGAYDAEFDKAKEKLNTLKEDPGNDVKLQMYALFKQITVGENKTPKPGMMDFVKKAKWQAWSSLGSMSQDDAQKQYIDLVNKLAGAESEAASTADPASAGSYKEIKVTRDGGLFMITLNRPAKKNAINYEMYDEVPRALAEAAEDKSVSLVTTTGAGDYYCSGNDLSNFANVTPDGIEAMAMKGRDICIKFVKSFIDFPKPLIALVNGPAVGISVTVMGLYDAVYASDKATFHTPFTLLGQSPEGCSSYTFPRMMGQAKANELLLFNKKISAVEAKNRNLVTEVFPDADFLKETSSLMQQYSKLPKQSLQKSKWLCRQIQQEKLNQINIKECELLSERWQSDECMNAIMNFFQQKSSKL